MRHLIVTLLSLFIFSACSKSPEQLISIDNAWLREAPPGATALAGYLTIHNHNSEDLSLNNAVSEDFGRIEFHQSLEEDGVYKMIPHTHLNIPANGQLALAPASYHLMMIDPKRTLTAGDEVSLSLNFSADVSMTVVMPVTKATHTEDHSHHHH